MAARRYRSGGPCALMFAVGLVFALAGCENVRANFMPLAPGNSWTYRVRIVVPTPADTGNAPRPVRETVRAPIRVKARRVLRSTSEADPTRRYTVEEPGGETTWSVFERTVMRSAGRTTTIVLQHPPFVGAGWMDSGPGGREVYCKVVAREDVRTPAGFFGDCIAVRREAKDRSSIVTQWFAPGVGIVKWRLARPGLPTVEWTLEEVELVAE